MEILSLENDVERVEEQLVDQKRNEAITQKLAVAKKTLELLLEKESELEKKIEVEVPKVPQIRADQLAYRDEYRIYERKRALGEEFDKIELRNGKTIEKARIKEVFTDKIRFTTQFGGASATWDELPQSWLERFQIGEGELEAHNAQMEEARRKRDLAVAAGRVERGIRLREMELKKALSRLSNSITKKKRDMENARAKVNNFRTKAQDYRNRAAEARQRGNISSHSNSAQKASAAAERLDAGVRITRDEIVEMEREKSRVEGELSQLQSQR